MSQKNNGISFLGGVLIGSGIGTVVGLLLAPRKGEETRKILRKTADALPEMAEDISVSVQVNSRRLTNVSRTKWNTTVTKVRKAIAVGIEASRQINNEK